MTSSLYHSICMHLWAGGRHAQPAPPWANEEAGWWTQCWRAPGIPGSASGTSGPGMTQSTRHGDFHVRSWGDRKLPNQTRVGPAARRCSKFLGSWRGSKMSIAFWKKRPKDVRQTEEWMWNLQRSGYGTNSWVIHRNKWFVTLVWRMYQLVFKADC